MKIIILKNKKEVAQKTSEIIKVELKRKPSLVLGLATGKTMLLLYKNLVSLYKKGKMDFSKTVTFNLDEYLEKNTLRDFMNKHLFNKINIKKENIYFLNGKARNIKKECWNYEKEIKKSNGIDLQILGIGKNDHIGFNEPGSNLNSKTRKVKLSNITRTSKSIPKYTLTMGLKTIMEAKKIVLLATGRSKANAIAKAIKGEISKQIPATILQKHKRVIFIIDESAASKL